MYIAPTSAKNQDAYNIVHFFNLSLMCVS